MTFEALDLSERLLTARRGTAYLAQRIAELTSLSDSFESFRGEVNNRFQQQDRRIDKQGSMSSAMLNMAINAAGSQSPRGRIAAGVGFQGGERALSVGYAKRIGQRASLVVLLMRIVFQAPS